MLIIVVYYCLPLVSGHEYKCLFINYERERDMHCIIELLNV